MKEQFEKIVEKIKTRLNVNVEKENDGFVLIEALPEGVNAERKPIQKFRNELELQAFSDFLG